MGFQQLTDYKATAENGHKALNNNLPAVRRQRLYKVEKQVGELGTKCKTLCLDLAALAAIFA